MPKQQRTYLAALVAVVATGCSASPELSPSQAALKASNEAVELARKDALEESNDQPSYQVDARYNPPRCPGPPFEIVVYDRWTRVVLEGNAEIMVRLEQVRQRAERGILEPIVVVGKLDGRGRYTETGASYPRFVANDVVIGRTAVGEPRAHLSLAAGPC